MFAPYRGLASSYRQVDLETSVEGATPHKLIAMLYDGAIAAIHRASASIARGDVAAKGEAITRAIRIVDEGLKASLDDRAGPIAGNLRDLYEYVGHRLLWANVHGDVAALEEAARLLGELQGAWLQITPKTQRTPAHATAA